MRVTAETRAATRKRILDAARRLFADNGFEATTTRDIAQAAGIATGTLFNYFATKDAIVACLASDAIGEAVEDFQPSGSEAASLEEELFAHIVAGLRKMKGLRKHLPALLETTLSPLAESSPDDAASLRAVHLQVVAKLAAQHGYGEISPVALQLYWTLYTGMLVYWANDRSRNQENTLALIDHSLTMFVSWLSDNVQPPTVAGKKSK
jgi:AcrR family transcriptional regulator